MGTADEVAGETSAALLATLRQASGADDLEFAGAPTVLRGGYYAELIRFSLADPPAALAGPLVARIVPNPATGAWEAALQGDVAAQGFATPKVRLVAGSDSALGRFVMVMDLVDGAPPLSGTAGPAMVGQIPVLLRRLPTLLAGLAASLHRLDPDAVAAELEALDGDIPTSTRGFVEQQIWSAAVADRPDLVAAGERLVASEPASTRRVISHGDLHPFNVLLTDDGPVLIDWSVARVAHPGFTLGFTDLILLHPPVEIPRGGGVVLGPVARGLARRFHRAYRSLAAPADQVSAEELAWHRKVHALRILVELAGWDAAGTRPASHPWLVLEPIVRRELGLDPTGR